MNGKLLRQVLDKMLKAPVAQNARVQVCLPDGKYYDITSLQLLENNVEPIQDSSVIIYDNKRYALLKSFKHAETKRQAHWKLSVIREAS